MEAGLRETDFGISMPSLTEWQGSENCEAQELNQIAQYIIRNF